VIVFDVGETLVDETRAWGVVARAAGVPALTLFGALGVVIERGEDHRQVWPLLGVDAPSLAPTIERSDLYPDAIPTLDALRRAGFGIGLAGNQPEQALGQLQALGLQLDFVVTSAGLGVRKPEPEFFASVVAATGLPAWQVAYVGDRLDNDVLPAARAGMFSVFLIRGPWAQAQKSRPEAASADLVIHGLAELPGALERR
jgi:HAD superfamily hydrolase (TIGR01509 family)